jgi:vacuolar protein sorting-associated protein VTA1
MTNNIPAGLRYADIGRFAMMAAQIEKVNPVVAYWCEPQYPRQCCNGQLELTESAMSQVIFTL